MDPKEVMSNRKALTKDEKLLLSLEDSDTEDGINPLFPAATLGISERTCNTMINQLAQINFVKKLRNGNVRITELGKNLCMELKTR